MNNEITIKDLGLKDYKTYKSDGLLILLYKKTTYGCDFYGLEIVSTDYENKELDEVKCLVRGEIFNGQVRHLYFGDKKTDNYGYLYCQNMEHLKKMLDMLEELSKDESCWTF